MAVSLFICILFYLFSYSLYNLFLFLLCPLLCTPEVLGWCRCRPSDSKYPQIDADPSSDVAKRVSIAYPCISNSSNHDCRAFETVPSAPFIMGKTVTFTSCLSFRWSSWYVRRFTLPTSCGHLAQAHDPTCPKPVFLPWLNDHPGFPDFDCIL